ncbi:MAG: SDR family oxidoreductase [Gammaproteobacteria bacterium]|nr:SDR family oxidoreductase [Gammaproteobacteria bacterium]MCD8542749.1 SDR family oxidoreductase [Gammaproteobacteria bacterium]
MSKNILIIGATSAIATAVARQYAAQGATLYLVARNEEKVQVLSNDLRIRGAKDVISKIADVDFLDQHEAIVKNICVELKQIDIALIAHGVLPDQKQVENDVGATLKSFNTNALSTISLLTLLAHQFVRQQQGVIAVITSVAGDRGRQSNYVYGASKSMVSTFLQGLRNRLFFHHVKVLDIKPGFVDTPMVAHLKKSALWAQPEKVAKDILYAIDKKKDILYTPFFWRYIMLIIKNIPECLFKQLKL